MIAKCSIIISSDRVPGMLERWYEFGRTDWGEWAGVSWVYE